MRPQGYILTLVTVATFCYAQGQTVAGKAGHGKTAKKLVRTMGVQSGNVECELQDKEGNLWFSIGGEGIYRYDGKTFTNFTEKDGLCSNGANPMIQDRAGNILIGTDRGICRFDGRRFARYFAADSLNDMKITCLSEDRKGRIWFGTMRNGLFCWDGQTCRRFLKNYDHPFNMGNSYQLIMDILEDKGGNLWFTSWNGGGAWRYDGKTFVNFLPSNEYYASNEDGRSFDGSRSDSAGYLLSRLMTHGSQRNIADDMIFSVSEDKAGNIWFATRRHGACKFDGSIFTSYGKNEGFTDYGVYSVLQDRRGNLWFTTDKNGVYRYDGKTFENFTEKDGLVNNSVFSVMEDRAGNIWFGTRQFGLSRYDGKTFTTFSGGAR